MEIIVILALIILVATVFTIILAITAYWLYKSREKKARREEQHVSEPAPEGEKNHILTEASSSALKGEAAPPKPAIPSTLPRIIERKTAPPVVVATPVVEEKSDTFTIPKPPPIPQSDEAQAQRFKVYRPIVVGNRADVYQQPTGTHSPETDYLKAIEIPDSKKKEHEAINSEESVAKSMSVDAFPFHKVSEEKGVVPSISKMDRFEEVVLEADNKTAEAEEIKQKVSVPEEASTDEKEVVVSQKEVAKNDPLKPILVEKPTAPKKEESTSTKTTATPKVTSNEKQKTAPQKEKVVPKAVPSSSKKTGVLVPVDLSEVKDGTLVPQKKTQAPATHQQSSSKTRLKITTHEVLRHTNLRTTNRRTKKVASYETNWS